MTSPTALWVGLASAIALASLATIAVVLLGEPPADPAPTVQGPAAGAPGISEPSSAPRAPAPVSDPAARSRCARVSADALEAIGEGRRSGVEVGGPAFYARTRAATGTWVIAARVSRGDRVGPGIWATRINPGRTSGLIGPFVALDDAARAAASWPAESAAHRLGPRPDGARAAIACLRAGRRI